MKITLECDDCTNELNKGREEDETISRVIMQYDGYLYFHNESKGQSQKYKCPRCGHNVWVYATVE